MWDENKHPRDGDGKFTGKEGAQNTSGRKFKIFTKPTTGNTTNSPNKEGKLINLQVFAAKLTEQSEKELKKSQKSYQKQINIHKKKIANPAIYIEKWDTKSEEYKQGIITRWTKEIKYFENTLKYIEVKLNEIRKK